MLMRTIFGLCTILAVAHAKTCVVDSQYASSSGTADDSPAAAKAFAECATDSTVIFSEGIDYNILTPIKASNLSNVIIQMQGNLHLPTNITHVQAIVNASANTNATALYWFNLNGPQIHYVGSSNVTNGWIKCYGQAWWDANPVNGTGITARPHLMNFNSSDSTIQHLKISQPIAWNVALNGKNITVTNSFIDAFSKSGSFPFNTDGFDVKGTDISILDSVIFNGDDAIAVQSGSHNILFRGGTIGYQSHGMSIGSLGQNQGQYANVSNITFDDITVVNAVYAARFKSWIGGQGLAKNISWKNIRCFNVTFPIFVTQSYTNQGSAQTQIETGSTTVRPNNSSVIMEDFTWANFTGTINTFNPGDGSCVTDPCWYDQGLPNLKHTEAIIVECNTETSCSSFAFENIQLMPQGSDPATVVCLNASAQLNPSLGFACKNGTFVPQ